MTEYEFCGLEQRHGSHPHTILTVEAQPTGVPAEYTEFECEGHDVVTVSYSELEAFRQCPFKHELAYGQRWTRDDQSDLSALGLGTLWHRVLETHYKTIQTHQEPETGTLRTVWGCSIGQLEGYVQVAVDNLLWTMEHKEGRDPEAIKVLAWMHKGYLEQYYLDEQWDIIAVENTAIIDLKNLDGTNSGYRLKVKIDLLVRDAKGNYWVIDHKSAGQMRDDDHDFNDQFGFYVAAMRQQGYRIMGAIHNAALKKPNQGDLIKPGDPGYKTTMKETPLDKRFKRTPLNRTEAECASILDDARATAELAYSEANHKRRYGDPERCRWKCDFKEACIFGRRTNNNAKTIQTLQVTGFVQDFTRH